MSNVLYSSSHNNFFVKHAYSIKRYKCYFQNILNQNQKAITQNKNEGLYGSSSKN